MSTMRPIAIIVPLLLSTVAGAAVQQQPYPALRPAPVAASSNYDVGYALNDWRRLRQSDGYAFGDYARFIIGNPGWPGETAMRRAAEKQMRAGEVPTTVLSFFASTEPQSGSGWARLAESYAATGRQVEALAAARSAWASGDLSAYDEQSLFARFASGLTTDDHDKRVDALLFARKTTDAYRMLPWTSAARRPALSARIALLSQMPDAEVRFAAVAGQVSTDAGLLMDRARYFRATNREQAARQLLARPHRFVHRPTNVDSFYEMLELTAKAAMADRQFQTAYDIARQVDDSFAPGVDLSMKSYGVRDKYTTLTWTAGMAALERLGRPRDAMAMFDRYAKGGRSLQVASKGYYWAGRAAAQANDPVRARAYFESAAATPELFYSQLALERLGRAVPAPAAASAALAGPAQRQAFQNKRLVRAVRILQSQGRRDEQSLFIRALTEDLKTTEDRALAAEMATAIGRQDLAVWTARSARNSGSAFYFRPAFPTHSSSVPGGRTWSLVHGITRQESSFDRAAVSHAGARGMMQLMPGTAREQAGKMGYGYDYGRLTSDPSYNVMLGSAYFQRLLAQWDGNYPLAVASYNAGAGNVRKWVRAYGDPRGNVDIVSWIEKIPFEETRGYVQRVLENSVVYDRLNPSLGTPQPVHISAYLGKASRPG
ncbi:lytic transglycosylase domain-containing protein [Sphingomonas sp. LY29]|uniref:lytic transglycosylase domain-containing protein n=1 Tax=Sphingomonas sp. LY29 TaxID=3095341 RepID=UPI002D7794C9|nr:lytic transglycosylase domain-containing protein [Sphingomonas sp. LY29]WRP25995.1 lytic transglycosylase domain-containing protein [Sphingomonas sp. LY29]